MIIADSTNGLVSETVTVATIEASGPYIDTDVITLMKSMILFLQSEDLDLVWLVIHNLI